MQMEIMCKESSKSMQMEIMCKGASLAVRSQLYIPDYTYTDADSNTNKAPSSKPRLKQTDIQAARQAHTARHIARHQANMHMYNITCFSNDTDRCQTSGTAAASEFKKSREEDCARLHFCCCKDILSIRPHFCFCDAASSSTSLTSSST